MMQLVAKALGPLNEEVAFVGGATIGLYLDNPIAPLPRASDDVDCVVEVATRTDYYAFEEKLRKLGFGHLVEPGKPICRWTVQGIIVDVMPVETAILGFKNRWYPEGFKAAVPAKLPDGTTVSIFSLPYLVASKMDAFKGRGKGDFVFSRDIEDLVALADGCLKFEVEILAAPAQVREAITKELKAYVANERFSEAVAGHLGASLAVPGRLDQVLAIFDRLSKLV